MELSPAERDECNGLITQLLQYTRSHLTTRVLAQYVIDTAAAPLAPLPKSILFLSPYILIDYLRDVLLQGLKVLYGSQCHDYPRVPPLYTSFPAYAVQGLYGKGMSVTRLIAPSARNSALDATVLDDIRNHKYDLVIFGSYHRGISNTDAFNKHSLIDLVRQHYKSNEIILICGEDHNINDKKRRNCCLLNSSEKNPTFIRELSDELAKD